LAAGLLSSLPGILFYHRGPQLEEAGLIRRAADYIYTSYDEQGNAYQRARGMLRSYTRSGLIAATSLPFIGVLAFLALKRRRWMWAAFHVLVGIICLYMLLLTKSRGAWLVGGAAVILAYLFLRGRWWHVALALAIGFLGLLALPTERARAMTLLQHARTPDLLLSGRLTLWQHGVDPIKSSPWVGIGYGQNIFQTQAAKDRGFILESDKIQPDLHQLYLQTLAEVGVLGLLVYTGFIAVLLLAGLTAIRRRADAEDAPATAAAFAAVICLLIVGIVYTYNEERVGHFIWAAAGLLVAKISESAPPPIQRHPDQVPHSPA
jgi:O-antigen ligase